MRPLTNLTKKKTLFIWSQLWQVSFDTVKIAPLLFSQILIRAIYFTLMFLSTAGQEYLPKGRHYKHMVRTLLLSYPLPLLVVLKRIGQPCIKRPIQYTSHSRNCLITYTMLESLSNMIMHPCICSLLLIHRIQK